MTNDNEVENKCTTLKVEVNKKDDVKTRLNDDVSQTTHSNNMPLRRKEHTTNKLTNSLRKSKHDRQCIKKTWQGSKWSRSLSNGGQNHGG